MRRLSLVLLLAIIALSTPAWAQDDLSEKWGQALEAAVEAFEKTVDEAAQALEKAADATSEALGKAVDTTTEALTKAMDAVEKGVKAAQEAVENMRKENDPPGDTAEENGELVSGVNGGVYSWSNGLA